MRLMKARTIGSGLFKKVNECSNILQWEKLDGVTTEGCLNQPGQKRVTFKADKRYSGRNEP